MLKGIYGQVSHPRKLLLKILRKNKNKKKSKKDCLTTKNGQIAKTKSNFHTKLLIELET